MSKALTVPSATGVDHQSRVRADGRGRIDELTDVAENILERLGVDGGADGVRGQGRIEGEDISSVTGDMGGSHGGSG